MKKHLNNKGYMLVEIILASAIAMGVAYFLTDLTIKLKNKNDDLLVKTLVYTDQAIIYNEIAKTIMTSADNLNCEDDLKNKIVTDGRKFQFKYSETNIFTNIVSEYAELGQVKCTYNDQPGNAYNYTKLIIPISVKQLPDENFDIVFLLKNP